MKRRSHHRHAMSGVNIDAINFKRGAVKPAARPVGRPPKYGEHVSQPWHAAYLEERLRAGMYA